MVGKPNWAPIKDPAAILAHNIAILRENGVPPIEIAISLKCSFEDAGVTDQPIRPKHDRRSQPVSEAQVLSAIAEVAARPLGPTRRCRQIMLLLGVGEKRFAAFRQQWPAVEAACQELYKTNQTTSPTEQSARSQATLTAVIEWADAQMAAGEGVSLHAACRSAQKGNGWLSVLCCKGDARAIELRERIRKYNKEKDNA